MIRLALSVEGQTEREFVNRVLAAHLRVSGVEATPVLLGRARGRAGGGSVSVERLASDMVRLSSSFDAVTSLVDFYGFRRKVDETPDALQVRVLEEIERRVGHEMNQSKMLPYVQQHAFESLLFSNLEAFAEILGVSDESVRSLWNIRSQFANPEDINDHSQTAPSVVSHKYAYESAGPFGRRLRCSSSRGNGHCSSSRLADDQNALASS